MDARFADSRATDRIIARHFAQPEAELIRLPRDVLELWHSRLGPACASTPEAFAGITTEQGFFLLRTLAADQRFRVHSLIALTTPPGDEPLVSWMLVPAKASTAARV